MKKKKKIEDLERELILPIEKVSMELSQSVETLKGELEGYYPRLSEEKLEEEAALKVESLKRASDGVATSAKDIFKMEDELRGRLQDAKRERADYRLIPPPTNATIDIQENATNHFAQGLNIYKILLVCFIGSFVGVIIEMIWCLLRNGYIESRAGLVYGPFNLVYGFGALALTVSLYNFRNRSTTFSFIGGMIIGTIVEFASSWFQEMVFGSRSWDYSNMPFSIQGRVTLLYSVFWGILGVFWIKNLYPRLAKWILKIPNKLGKVITWLLVVFLLINASISSIAVARWSTRVDNIEPAHTFWEIVDERFPDERMERIYANMVFAEK